MKSMTGTGLEIKLLLGIKYLAIALFVWYIEPIIGYVLIQIDTVGLLSPYIKACMEDVKVILGVLISFLLVIKYIYDISKGKGNSEKK